MRVRISYGVDIKEVPEKVRDLLYDSLATYSQAKKLLERAIEDCENCEENSKQIFSSLDRARKKLASVDLVIVDSQSIIQGLDSYYNGEENVPDGRSTMDTSRNVAEET